MSWHVTRLRLTSCLRTLRCTESTEGAMPKLELSDRFIATLKPQEDKAADYFDSKAKGLNLRITPTGVKAWSVMFTSPKDGKRAWLSLGTYPATPLARARVLARA